MNLLRKVRLEIAVNDEFVKPTVDAILKAAKTGDGKIGDGKIFITPLEDEYESEPEKGEAPQSNLKL
ncbi:nitrogen regulatory protein P-II-like protein [Leptospira interrogans serovar Bataviae str. HAI135]|nr:nitrogen regulatory protein P-II-like protein [Leptospira interrogans serovar Bataviae str. HAI135]